MTCLDCEGVAAENAELRRLLGSPSAPPPVPETVADALGLTRRECDVLALIARGLSTAEIAGELYLSVNSIKTHTRTLYGKLGITSRLQVAVWVWRRGWAETS